METPVAPRLAPVGFIGLGQMGAPIALRLQTHGHPLVLYSRSRAKAEALLVNGARWAETPAAVARATPGGVVFTCLTDGRAVRSVLFGRRGVAAGACPGSLVVDLSTVTPEESRSFAERLSPRGVHFTDIPLGGSVDAASSGQLLLYAGGAAEDLARVQPLLEAFSRRVERLGGVGAGTSMKLVNNLVTLVTLAVDSEALALAEGLGLDRRRVIDLLLDGGWRSVMLERKRTFFEGREYPSQFRLPLARKDLGLMERTARAVGASARLTRETRRLVDEALAAGHGAEDTTAMFEAALARGRTRPAAAGSPTAPR
jgi:3-hydroxyisobutyrate dehydrogenase